MKGKAMTRFKFNKQGKKCNTCGKIHFKVTDDMILKGPHGRLTVEGNLWFNCACGSTLMVIDVELNETVKAVGEHQYSQSVLSYDGWSGQVKQRYVRRR